MFNIFFNLRGDRHTVGLDIERRMEGRREGVVELGGE